MSSTPDLTPDLTLVLPPDLTPQMDANPVQAIDESQLRSLTQGLLSQIQQQATELTLRQTQIDALTHEIRLLRHLRFCAKNEAMNGVQVQLFEEANAEDLAAAEEKLSHLTTPVATTPAKKQPARQALPAELPRVEVIHEPSNTTCGCGKPMKRISQDVSERLDYVPGTFRVERHVRGVWACSCCECVRQQAMPAQVIDGGIPTSNLLAQVVVSKYMDHLPLFRQAKIFARSGVDLGMSTLADWVGACGVALAPLAQALKVQLLQASVLHADESPILILGTKGKTKRGDIWAYASGVHAPLQAVVFEIKPGRSGQYARDFLRHDRKPPVSTTLAAELKLCHPCCFQLQGAKHERNGSAANRAKFAANRAVARQWTDTGKLRATTWGNR